MEKLMQLANDCIEKYQQDVTMLQQENDLMNEMVRKCENENRELIRKLMETIDKRTTESNKESQRKRNEDKNSRQESKEGSERERVLTQKDSNRMTKLKQTIQEIYISKKQFESESKNRKETLEQFLYSYIKKKYGLKELVYKNIEDVVDGIKEYKDYSSDIYLFGKIVRNAIDEAYIQVH